MTPRTRPTYAVWVGQFWYAKASPEEVVRITVFDPYLGLVGVENDHGFTVDEPAVHFLASSRRLYVPDDPHPPIGEGVCMTNGLAADPPVWQAEL